MTKTIQELTLRKSVRVYSDKAIEDDKKADIINGALQAPTAGNMTLYSILDITDQSLKAKLAISCDNQPFIAKAPMVLIFCADYKRWYDIFCNYEETVRKPSYGDFLLACEDTMIAAQNAVVAAESLGIGSCYIGDILENMEYHRELLNLPKYVAPIGMVCFGYPTEQQANRQKPKRFDQKYIVHENVYKEATKEVLKEMMEEHTGKSGEQLAEDIRAFCKRKWNSEFSEEMSRSAGAIIEAWVE